MSMMDWVVHFGNRPLLDLSGFGEERISVMEKAWVGKSVAEFMRGESSEARDFIEKSRRFVLESGDGDFLKASQIFVKEENNHSAMLAAFMAQHGIEALEGSWTDDVFRWVRSRGDIGWCSTVLLAAEVLAQVYYPALLAATSSGMMAAICERIIEDEAYHIEFQAERIGLVLKRRGRFYRLGHGLGGFVLFWGTAVVMWHEHRSVLARSLSFWSYLKQSFLRREMAMRLLREWTAGGSGQWVMDGG